MDIKKPEKEFRPAEEVAVLLGIASNKVKVTIGPNFIKIHNIVPTDKQAAIKAWANELWH